MTDPKQLTDEQLLQRLRYADGIYIGALGTGEGGYDEACEAIHRKLAHREYRGGGGLMGLATFVIDIVPPCQDAAPAAAAEDEGNARNDVTLDNARRRLLGMLDRYYSTMPGNPVPIGPPGWYVHADILRGLLAPPTSDTGGGA